MNIKSTIAVAGLGLAALSAGSASAAVYNFAGSITLCTSTCDSFAALDVGSQVAGQLEIDTTAGGSWSFADISSFAYQIFNPGAPMDPGPSPATINPLPLIDSIAPIRESIGGPLSLMTGGTTDAGNGLDSGVILHEFAIPPFNSNTAWAIFNISAGGNTVIDVCLFAPTAGCIDGATRAVQVTGQFTLVPIPAAAWLFGSAILGIFGLRRRA